MTDFLHTLKRTDLHKSDAQSGSKWNALDQNRSFLCKNLQKELLAELDYVTSEDLFKQIRLSVVLDTRRRKNSGLYPIKLRIYFRSKAVLIPLGVDCREQDFEGGRITGRYSRVLNNRIDDKRTLVGKLVRRLFEQDLLTSFETVEQLRDFVVDTLAQAEGIVRPGGRDPQLPGGVGSLVAGTGIRLDQGGMPQQGASYLLSRWERYLHEEVRADGSVRSHMSAMNKVRKFLGPDAPACRFQDIDKDWLRAFEDYCLDTGMTTNGVAHYLRNLRTICNVAIDEEIVPLDWYPFRRFRIKSQRTAHRVLSLEELRTILYADVAELSQGKKVSEPLAARTIDFFALSFYFCGINPKDLLLMTPEELQGDRIVMQRRKTGEPISLKVEPEARTILERHMPGKEGRLLDFLDTYSTNEPTWSFTRNTNKYLKRLFDQDKLTLYWIRHTWATLASSLGVDDPIIDVAQGRTPPGMAGVYIVRSLAKVDEANRRVLDLVKGAAEVDE